MTKASVTVHLDRRLRQEAEHVLGELGLTPDEAITLLYRAVVAHHALPFEVSIPNAATLRTMHDAESARGVTRARGADELFVLLDE